MSSVDCIFSNVVVVKNVVSGAEVCTAVIEVFVFVEVAKLIVGSVNIATLVVKSDVVCTGVAVELIVPDVAK